MPDTEALDSAVRTALDLPDDADLSDIEYGRTQLWDSVGHMQLVTAIEVTFGITIDAEDVVEMSDYPAIRRVLRDHHGRSIEA